MARKLKVGLKEKKPSSTVSRYIYLSLPLSSKLVFGVQHTVGIGCLAHSRPTVKLS